MSKKQTVRETVGLKLLAFRRSRGLSQKQVGDAIGRRDSTVGDWERGASCPGLDDVLALSEHFDVDLEEFLPDQARPRDSLLVDVRWIERFDAAKRGGRRDLWAERPPLLTTAVIPVRGCYARVPVEDDPTGRVARALAAAAPKGIDSFVDLEDFISKLKGGDR
jgi:transcriptional regulator with XRE-family HTH domain